VQRALMGLAVLATAAVLVSMAPTGAAQAVHVAVNHYSGTLPDGATPCQPCAQWFNGGVPYGDTVTTLSDYQDHWIGTRFASA
jgi:hypothetical protein